jgi:hypothetical protein
LNEAARLTSPLTRWNDTIGAAPPPGLSRLQRERMEKKMRKGTLRAA